MRNFRLVGVYLVLLTHLKGTGEPIWLWKVPQFLTNIQCQMRLPNVQVFLSRWFAWICPWAYLLKTSITYHFTFFHYFFVNRFQADFNIWLLSKLSLFGNWESKTASNPDAVVESRSKSSVWLCALAQRLYGKLLLSFLSFENRKFHKFHEGVSFQVFQPQSQNLSFWWLT